VDAYSNVGLAIVVYTAALTGLVQCLRFLQMKPIVLLALETGQRRAARFVHNNYTERTPGCVTHMVQNLGWQPLQQRRYNNHLIIMFKIIHELVDIQTDVIRTGDSRTRGSNRLYQPVAQKDVYKFSFFC
jgi:hypothetical protein